jgi:glycosyltransferase involved in cell wall biosynthesis
MKILQIVNPVIPFPAVTVGGKERIVQYLMHELVNRGHEVTLMGHDDSVVQPGVKFIPIGTYLDQRKTNQKIWKHLLLNKYDVLHNHGRLIYFLPKIWANTRKIHTFHMAELETRSFKRFLALKAKNLTFCPCSKWIKDKSRHLKGHWDFVQNGLPLDLYRFYNREVSLDAPLVIIARIGLSKGILDAVQIAKQSNRKLIIAGKIGDYPHEIAWFNNSLRDLCDGEKIRFIGPIDDQQKETLLNSALALLIPTIDSEAFNTTMIEANACGCPVLSYNRFCFTEFIEQGINGFKGNTLDELADHVNQLHLIDRAKCREIFEQRYTADIMATNYLKLYVNQAI